MGKISAYFLTKNEEKNVAAAIDTLDWVDEILIVDTGSTDNTIAIARSMGARVVEIPFTGFGTARNHALQECRHEWVFCTDADERCTEDLRDEIIAIAKQDKPTAVNVAPRKNFFLGRWIKHSGWYPNYTHPVFYRKVALQYTLDVVHESYITQEKVHHLKHHLLHTPYPNFEKLLHKTNLYSTLGAKRLKDQKRSASYKKALVCAIWAFIHQYFIRRGVLDGWPGFILSMNYFHVTFYRYAKAVENENSAAEAS